MWPTQCILYENSLYLYQHIISFISRNHRHEIEFHAIRSRIYERIQIQIQIQIQNLQWYTVWSLYCNSIQSRMNTPLQSTTQTLKTIAYFVTSDEFRILQSQVTNIALEISTWSCEELRIFYEIWSTKKCHTYMYSIARSFD